MYQLFSINEVEWYVKPNSTGTYVKQLQPSEFDIELEDLDSDSYRSIVTGNLIDNPIAKNWSKCKFKFSNLTKQQAYDLLQRVSATDIYAKIENPVYSGGFVEARFRCSKKSIKKLKTKNEVYEVSFNLVQKNKIAGM